MNQEKSGTGKNPTPQVDNVRPCPQDCAKCNPWQQVYCCTKMTYDMSQALAEARKQTAEIMAGIAYLKSLMEPPSDQFIDPKAQ